MGRSKSLNIISQKSLESNTLTPKSPKCSTELLSPVALQEYQSDQESQISSLTDKISTFEAREALNTREMLDMKEKLNDAREYHEVLIERVRQQDHEMRLKKKDFDFHKEHIESEKIE